MIPDGAAWWHVRISPAWPNGEEAPHGHSSLWLWGATRATLELAVQGVIVQARQEVVMSWIKKFRGDSTAPILAEYECPIHGRFEVTVQRPEPDESPCPNCGSVSSWRFPMPRGRVKVGEVVQGKVMEYPPEQVCLDTRPLADGMPLGEWRDKQRRITRDIGLKRSRAGRR